MKNTKIGGISRAGALAVWLGIGGLAGAAETAPLKITIEGDDRMRFDIEQFAVEPGQAVELTLEHVGQVDVEAMGHNVVILKDPGAKPVDFGLRVQAEGGDLENHYVPEAVRDEVIAFTEMIGGGEKSTVTFTAPGKPGKYPYLCSFPMHAELMTGVMVVGDGGEDEAGTAGAPGAGERVLPDPGDFPPADELTFDPDAVPEVLDGFVAEIWAREPMLMHPSALAFDARGRLYVGGGPQYRNPGKDDPKDSIRVMIDADGDGAVDDTRVFAEGLNSVQSLAWRGDELWVANAPDLTVLRDTDGDLRADEYEKIYTHLGHLRHGLHGFNFAPDGRLYMTQGDSQVQPGAPQAFRDLHGVQSDEPDNQPLNEVFAPEDYEADFHDRWPGGQYGGWLRAGERGEDLEIFARGGRNPWDMTFTASFDWVGVDQDPGDAGDLVLMPFEGAHFSKGHPRGGSWGGRNNPGAVDYSYHFTRYKKNSLVGTEYYLHEHFPEAYRDVVFINDWVNRNIYVFRPSWNGAALVDAGDMEEFANGGEHGHAPELVFNPGEGDPLFRPTDMAVGPEGALYVGGWGTQYGSRWAPFIDGDEDAAVHWGRVFRIRHGGRPVTARDEWHGPKRDKPHAEWSADELIDDLGGQLPVWRIDAQDELVRRGERVAEALRDAIRGGGLSPMAETYAVWALGRIDPEVEGFTAWARGEDGSTLNRRLQAIRVLGDRGVESAAGTLAGLLGDDEPRVRFAAAQALRWLKAGARINAVLTAVEKETDPLCFHAQWLAMRAMADPAALAGIVASSDSVQIQAAGLLALGAEDHRVEREAVEPPDDREALSDATLAIEQWLDRND